MNLFALSDIHGMYKHFEQLLTHWDPKDKLVILGDLIDRGPDSLKVIQKIIELKATYGDQILLIKGNHDQMVLNFLDNAETGLTYYASQGGDKTLISFLKDAPEAIQNSSPTSQADYLKEHFQEELALLNSGELYKTIGDVLFTHAGFDSSHTDFSNTIEKDFYWIRKHYLQPNLTPYTNVFGHTPTTYIHDSNEIWVSEDKKYIAIDGGCVFGGQLNGVLLNLQGEILQTFHIKDC